MDLEAMKAERVVRMMAWPMVSALYILLNTSSRRSKWRNF